ncbi:MAG: hypothetical protein DIU62_004205 [Pseudomonadota bacterium]|jgi:hypothetical protein|nr:MAG: hypothetical protein DIU62_03110 [Pseudomonadota bacterium]
MGKLIARMGMLLAGLAAGLVMAAEPAGEGRVPRYTFSWPLGADAPAPRGGTTRGAPVKLATGPSAEWQALQAPDLAPQERDRRAILAMAGTYRVTFDFLEVATFPDEGQRPRPYQSWGTEKVYVDRDEPGFVSLVHILEMRVVGEDGRISEPMVTKHWRQDWRYEPAYVIEHEDGRRWRRRTLSAEERRGAWSQTVYQVDESPRYGSVGRWEHNASFSSWIGGETARPLPRREWSVRNDYQLLYGTNRHTILPRGWLHEENNLKRTVGNAPLPYVGREYGVARYERIVDADFAAADRYYEATREFWDAVLEVWEDVWSTNEVVEVTANSDQSGAFAGLFQLAEAFAAGRLTVQAAKPRIRAALEAQGVGRR